MVELHITVRFPVSQLSSLNPQLNKAALRLCFNPFGSQARPFPYIAGDAATQGETLLRFCVKESKKIGKTGRTLLCLPIDSRP